MVNLHGSMFRLWAVASLIWISFIFIFAYQQTSTRRHVSIAAYTSYATFAFAPVCGTFALLFISGWIVAGFTRPR
jgi:chromate transport protein ChrA